MLTLAASHGSWGEPGVKSGGGCYPLPGRVDLAASPTPGPFFFVRACDRFARGRGNSDYRETRARFLARSRGEGQ